ncbi:uncharacterized protein LOC34618305 [Cyclospora cayetanensis]|uniref:Uncharacterized protein LOC34618305 n=1 Tax=Cyclospora cayetanensis TaxID=88456 RepID=A0A6P6S427_9EIME|nr:uncharacterized protein LOC34618305 [Cyclospora cayetanensis]
MLGASHGPQATRQVVRLCDSSQRWIWNPYAGGLGCSSMLGTEPCEKLSPSAPVGSSLQEVEKLREMYKDEVSMLTLEHELLLYDLKRFHDMTALYRDAESGSFLLTPPEAILEAKKGIDLRIEHFKDECGRCERLQRRMQRQMDKGPPVAAKEGSSGPPPPSSNSPEAVAANCILLKRVRDQRRLIALLQRDLEERLYEQSLMEVHLKKLRQAAEHLDVSLPADAAGKGSRESRRLPGEAPSLHQREKQIPEFKTAWLHRIRFATAPLPRVPSRQPPVPPASCRPPKAVLSQLSRGDSTGGFSFSRGPSRTCSSPRVSVSAPKHKDSRTLTSPRKASEELRGGSLATTAHHALSSSHALREDSAASGAAETKAPLRQTSYKTLASPRVSAAAGGVVRADSRTLMSPREARALDSPRSRSLVSPRRFEGAPGA